MRATTTGWTGWNWSWCGTAHLKTAQKKIGEKSAAYLPAAAKEGRDDALIVALGEEEKSEEGWRASAAGEGGEEGEAGWKYLKKRSAASPLQQQGMTRPLLRKRRLAEHKRPLKPDFRASLSGAAELPFKGVLGADVPPPRKGCRWLPQGPVRPWKVP